MYISDGVGRYLCAGLRRHCLLALNRVHTLGATTVCGQLSSGSPLLDFNTTPAREPGRRLSQAFAAHLSALLAKATALDAAAEISNCSLSAFRTFFPCPVDKNCGGTLRTDSVELHGCSVYDRERETMFFQALSPKGSGKDNRRVCVPFVSCRLKGRLHARVVIFAR